MGKVIKEEVSLIKGTRTKVIKILLLRVNEKGEQEKINVRLVRDIFSIPNKNYLYEGDIKRELEFFFPENIQQILPENNSLPKLKEGTSI